MAAKKKAATAAAAKKKRIALPFSEAPVDTADELERVAKVMTEHGLVRVHVVSTTGRLALTVDRDPNAPRAAAVAPKPVEAAAEA